MYVCTCMYVCMYACMYVCMYVQCMYSVCTHVYHIFIAAYRIQLNVNSCRCLCSATMKVSVCVRMT